MMAMEISERPSQPTSTLTSPNPNYSLKKLKREASQRQKSQARPMKIRPEEDREKLLSQQRQQLVEHIDSIQEQDQRTEKGQNAVGEADINTFLEHQCNGNEGDESIVKAQMNSSTDKKPGWKGLCNTREQGKEKQQDSRRRLARGPRSGATVAPDTMQNMFLVPSEDHRVVSTEYQSAGTQVLMRVTLLAAGFVIGARGNSARLIGQATGAIVQSWTETNCSVPDAVPIRLFRIQGKKPVVQAAVNLIEQAVAKYRELCECKRRGEFVQREHVISGVEFYYQPPPRKAFENENMQKLNNSCDDQSSPPCPTTNPHPNNQANPHSHHNNSNIIPSVNHNNNPNAQAHHNDSNPNPNTHYNNNPNPYPYPQHNHFMGIPPGHPASFPPNNVWGMHQFHNQQKLYNAYSCCHQHACTRRYEDISMAGLNSLKCFNMNMMGTRGLFDWQGSSQVSSCATSMHPEDLHQTTMSSEDKNLETSKEDEEEEEEILLPDLNQCMASLQEGLQNMSLDDEEPINKNTNKKSSVDPWSLLVQHRHEQMSSSLFSFFGYGGLPLPVAPHQTPCTSSELPSVNNSSHIPTTAFDFSSCDFLGGRFPAFSFASAINSKPPSICTAFDREQQKEIDSHEDQIMCALCIHQQAGVRLMGCGHSICVSCTEAHHGNCPICGQTILGVQQLDSRGVPNPSPTLNGSCYHLWDWSPETSP